MSHKIHKKLARETCDEADGAHRESDDEGSDASIDASEQYSCSEDEEEDESEDEKRTRKFKERPTGRWMRAYNA